MKVKHALILLLVGFCLDFAGAVLKIMHQAHGDTILIISTVLKVIGGLLLFYKILTHPKIKDALNW